MESFYVYNGLYFPISTTNLQYRIEMAQSAEDADARVSF